MRATGVLADVFDAVVEGFEELQVLSSNPLLSCSGLGSGLRAI